MRIFVPGRLCLFGEHSDWAGEYRRLNPEIEKGYTLIVGTNQGIYADVKPNSTQLIIRASLNDGSCYGPLRLPMESKILNSVAKKGGFFSYAAGTAYQFLTHYRVGGLEVDNYLTDLPIQKGLSSSAAICVLMARAFNRLYNLKMTIREEMELAYLGERTTPSLCGRMDQACAYGNRPVLMIFNGDQLDLNELKVPKDLFVVIVELGGHKNTQEILSRLNQCYPFATNQIQQNVQKYLGSISSEITQAAVEAIQTGDAQLLGALMTKAQAEFDQHVVPACPSQLTAPKLHLLLHHQPLQPYIFGGKGVGSQGDGTAQLLVKNQESQRKAIAIIKRDFPQMQTLELTILANKKVRKAVIPAADFGTRLFPATKAVKKELFPIIDRDGRAKPIILILVEEVIQAGIEQIGIVVQKEDLPIFQNFFHAPPQPELYAKLSPENQKYSRYLQDLGQHITFLIQEQQEGYGHAVFCTKQWINQEPFLLLLGDHVYASNHEHSCASQLLQVFHQFERTVVGLTVMPAEIIHKAGCVTGIWQEPNSILNVSQLYEKPELEYARANLHVAGMPESNFLGVFGMYLLQPTIFKYLEQEINNNLRYKGEFQLTTSLDRLCQDEGIIGYLVKGQCFDTGMPRFYQQTMSEFSQTSPSA